MHQIKKKKKNYALLQTSLSFNIVLNITIQFQLAYRSLLYSSLCFIQPSILMMYSAYKLNKQGDNIQPWRAPFPMWNQSVVSCPVLTVAFWPAYRFLKRQVRWSGIPTSYLTYMQSTSWETYLTYMQSTSWETLGWMKHKLESRLSKEI